MKLIEKKGAKLNMVIGYGNLQPVRFSNLLQADDMVGIDRKYKTKM